ncbi:rhodanese-like domain-containing protein [Microbacterium koreense]|uniref:Rhodanese-like domain-containing protein n=1 Tax=Microbacterium koreense TaxID=323761 RepID=A0ABW2ZQ37_9MICO
MKSIDVHQLASRDGVPLIDVREEHEFVQARVPGAVNIPMSVLGERLDELPAEAFDLICKSGGRSARVAQALDARGYDTTNVEGGTDGWIAAGYDIER